MLFVVEHFPREDPPHVSVIELGIQPPSRYYPNFGSQSPPPPRHSGRFSPLASPKVRVMLVSSAWCVFQVTDFKHTHNLAPSNTLKNNPAFTLSKLNRNKEIPHIKCIFSRGITSQSNNQLRLLLVNLYICESFRRMYAIKNALVDL